jgi:single-stranded-DNA-specific exonuclease
MSLKWNFRVHDAHLIQSIERASGVSSILAQILALRGISRADQINQFLDLKLNGLRPPEDLPGVPQASAIIYAAVRGRKKIFVYGDYDCDGMTATAILFLCLQKLGADVHYFVPSRLDDGYGLSVETLARLIDRGADLIVSVDCGVASVKEVEFVKQAGRQIVITDHHHFGDALPAADAMVHPAHPEYQYPFVGLCGAGVAFKLAWDLCQKHHGSPKLPADLRDFLFSAIALAAIGTVADVVPLLDENRILVHNGLNCLRQFANPGLRCLLQLAKCWDKPRLEAEDIAFGIGPRLNAAGRLGQAQLGVELLTCQNEDRAKALAEYIDELNKTRDTLDRKILKAANRLIKDQFDPENEPALVLAESDWHLGVIGIVAGRIAETYHRPTVLISTDSGGVRPAVGSCRTACGVNLYQALDGCRDHLLGFGGHSAAAGLKIEANQIDAFRETFCEQVVAQASIQELVPDLEIDAEALLGNLTLGTMEELNKLAPFGQDNPRPVLCALGVRLAEPAKPMGDGRHLSVMLAQHSSRMRAVAFGKGDWIEKLTDTDARYDFAFRPVINNYRGYRSVELQLLDFRPATADKVVAG